MGFMLWMGRGVLLFGEECHFDICLEGVIGM